MKEKLQQLLMARAGNRCECGCHRSLPPAEPDHWFGRAKAEEVEFTVWLLSPSCHRLKTLNSPSYRHWAELFISFCERWGYSESKKRTENDLAWRMAKGTTA